MNIGDRFEKDGKLVEVLAINSWGYSYKVVPKTEVFAPTTFDFPAESEIETEIETEEIEEKVKEPEEVISVPKAETKKVVRRRKKV